VETFRDRYPKRALRTLVVAPALVLFWGAVVRGLMVGGGSGPLHLGPVAWRLLMAVLVTAFIVWDLVAILRGERLRMIRVETQGLRLVRYVGRSRLIPWEQVRGAGTSDTEMGEHWLLKTDGGNVPIPEVRDRARLFAIIRERIGAPAPSAPHRAGPIPQAPTSPPPWQGLARKVYPNPTYARQHATMLRGVLVAGGVLLLVAWLLQAVGSQTAAVVPAFLGGVLLFVLCIILVPLVLVHTYYERIGGGRPVGAIIVDERGIEAGGFHAWETIGEVTFDDSCTIVDTTTGEFRIAGLVPDGDSLFDLLNAAARYNHGLAPEEEEE
jgi:hypothetical protein